MNKSRPIYAPFQFDPSGARHLLVTDQPDPPADLNTNVQTLTARTHTADAILAFLPPHLATQTTGLRLYAIGSEAFVWDVNAIALAAGMGAGEVHLTRAGPLIRRVYCTHCQTMADDVATTITQCPGCGATLEVRDHFSRHHRAFMGVQVDAEAPGEIPAPEGFRS